MSTKERFNKLIELQGYVFIAEISSNHLGDITRLEKIIEVCKRNKADAVKIQTFTADSLTHSTHNTDNFLIKEGPWKGKTYRQLYKEIEVPLEWTIKAKNIADNYNIPIISSPFSREDLKFLLANNFDMIKIASAEINHLLLIEDAIKSDCDLIASLGFYDDQIGRKLKALKAKYNKEIYCALNCVAKYPAELKDLNRELFNDAAELSRVIGLSDHSIGTEMMEESYKFGAKIFEKHITLDRRDGGPDSSFSIEPRELNRHIETLKNLRNNRSEQNKKREKKEEKGRIEQHKGNFSRSIYMNYDTMAGELITENKIDLLRPNIGLNALEVNWVIGRKLIRDKKAGEALHRDDIQL